MLVPRPPKDRTPLAPVAQPLVGEVLPSAPPGGPHHPALPDTLSATPTLSALLGAVQRRCVLTLTLAILAGTCAGAIAWQFAPEPKYQVRAMVHIASVPERLIGRGPGDGEANFAYFQKTQIARVKSQVVLDSVLRNPEIASLKILLLQRSPKEWLFSRLEADFKQGPEVLSISMKGDETEDMPVILNAVMKAYLEEFVNVEEARLKARLQKLTEVQTKQQQAVSQKRAKLHKLAAKMGAGDWRLIHGLHDSLLKQMHHVKEELQTIEADRSKAALAVPRLESELLQARGSKAPAPAPVIVAATKDDPEIKRLQEEHNRLSNKLSDLRKNAQQDLADKLILKVRNDIQFTKKELDARRSELVLEATEVYKAQRIAELEVRLGEKKEELTFLTDRESRLQTMLVSLSADAKKKGEDSFDLGLQIRELEDDEKILAEVVTDIRNLRLNMVAPPRVKPLEEAVVMPNTGRKRLLLTVGSAGAAVALVVLAIALWEFSKRQINCADELIFGFGIGVVGTLPRILRKRSQCPRERGEPVQALSGYIDSFRTILLHGDVGRKLRVVLVTSAEPGEGKTSLSGHLAASLARSGRKTLLLDGDMRRPTAHQLFGLERGPGLSEVLRKEATPETAIQPTGVTGLWVLTAGASCPEAYHQLGGEQLVETFRSLKKDFDVIVVDSCPVLPVADSLHLARCADGVVMSVLRRVSRLPKLSAALGRIRMLGVPVLGAVINGTDEDVYSTGYYTPLVGAE